MEKVKFGLLRILHHPVVGGGRGHIGDFVVLQRLQQKKTAPIKPAGEVPSSRQRQGRQGAMPRRDPKRRGGKRIGAARPDTGSVERGKHQRDQRALRVLHCAGSSRVVPEVYWNHRHIVGALFNL